MNHASLGCDVLGQKAQACAQARIALITSSLLSAAGPVSDFVADLLSTEALDSAETALLGSAALVCEVATVDLDNSATFGAVATTTGFGGSALVASGLGKLGLVGRVLPVLPAIKSLINNSFVLAAELDESSCRALSYD